ncbi:MAG TPA: hypothetical protein VK348_03045 [Planctomycetota bacterium]|nr:hypothetical protein [Planctomycetota bacterium]
MRSAGVRRGTGRWVGGLAALIAASIVQAQQPPGDAQRAAPPVPHTRLEGPRTLAYETALLLLLGSETGWAANEHDLAAKAAMAWIHATNARLTLFDHTGSFQSADAFAAELRRSAEAVGARLLGSTRGFDLGPVGEFDWAMARPLGNGREVVVQASFVVIGSNGGCVALLASLRLPDDAQPPQVEQRAADLNKLIRPAFDALLNCHLAYERSLDARRPADGAQAFDFLGVRHVIAPPKGLDDATVGEHVICLLRDKSDRRVVTLSAQVGAGQKTADWFDGWRRTLAGKRQLVETASADARWPGADFTYTSDSKQEHLLECRRFRRIGELWFQLRASVRAEPGDDAAARQQLDTLLQAWRCDPLPPAAQAGK